MVIFCDPAVTITTNLLLIFFVCPASAEDKYYAIRLKKYSFKKRKKIKNACGGPYILLHKSVYIFTYDFVQYVHVKLII